MTEVLYYFYSKYSQASLALKPTLEGLQRFFTIHFVDIDNPYVRAKVLQTDIKTVPCIITLTKDRILIMENNELSKFVMKLQDMVIRLQAVPQSPMDQGGHTQLFEPYQAQPQQQYPVQPSSMVQSIVDPSLAATSNSKDLSYGSSLNSRLQPQTFTSPPPPQPAVTHQIAQQQAMSTTQMGTMLANQHNASTTSPQTAAMMIQDPITGGAPANQSLSAVQIATQMMSQMQANQQGGNEPQGFANASFIEVPTDNSSATFSTQGAYTPDMISGGTAGIRKDNEGNNAVRMAAEQAMREREEADRSYSQRPPMY